MTLIKSDVLNWELQNNIYKYSVFALKKEKWEKIVDIYNPEINKIVIQRDEKTYQNRYRVFYYLDAFKKLKMQDLYVRTNNNGSYCFYFPNPHIKSVNRVGDTITIYWEKIEGIQNYRLFKSEHFDKWQRIIDVAGDVCVLKSSDYSEHCRFVVRGMSDNYKEYLTDYDL